MARDDPQFRIRLPADLKTRVEERATSERRSLNAEIVYLLEFAMQEIAEYERHESLQNSEEDDDVGEISDENISRAIEKMCKAIEELRAHEKNTRVVSKNTEKQNPKKT